MIKPVILRGEMTPKSPRKEYLSSTTPAVIEPRSEEAELPQLLVGSATPELQQRFHKFVFSVAEIFEAWVHRRHSPHTRRAYRQDVMTFVKFLGIVWPDQAPQLLKVSVPEVLA